MRITDETSIYGYHKRQSGIYWLLLCMFAGIVIGTVIVCTADSVKWLDRLLFTHNMYKNMEKYTVLKLCFRNFIPIFAVLSVQFFMGFFAFGQVFAVFTTIYRGIAAGISASLFYLLLGIKGVFASAVMVLPFAFVTAVVVILGARESVRMSKQLAEFSFAGRRCEFTSPDIKLYMLKYGVLAVFAVVFSIADVLIAYLFSGVF